MHHTLSRVLVFFATLGAFVGKGIARVGPTSDDDGNVLRFGSVCESIFWTCSEDGVATLSGNALKNAFPVLFTKAPKLNVDFKRDAGIKKVIMQTEAALVVESLAGEEIEEIIISGGNKTLSNNTGGDLCAFLNNTLLPSLTLVKVKNARLDGLNPVLFNSCPSAVSGNQLEVLIHNTEIFVDDNPRNNGQMLVLDPPVLKKFSLNNVTLHNVQNIKASRLEKLKIVNVALTDTGRCCFWQADRDDPLKGIDCRNDIRRCGFMKQVEPVGQDGEILGDTEDSSSSVVRSGQMSMLSVFVMLAMVKSSCAA